MLITTALLAITPSLQGPLPPQIGAPGRTPTHFQCLRVDNIDQACILAEAATEVFDFMTMNMQTDMDGPISHTGEMISHTTVASGSSIGRMSATSTLLATAINVTPRGSTTYVPQVTANLFGRLNTQNLNLSGITDARWEILFMEAAGNYQVLPRSDATTGFANLNYVLYAYCVGQDPAGAVDPMQLTMLTMNASNSNLLFTHLGPNAGWMLQGSLERSSSANPNAAPDQLNTFIPDTFNQAWVGTQAVPVGPNGGGLHWVSFTVSNANAMLLMSSNQQDASDWTIGGSSAFHVRLP